MSGWVLPEGWTTTHLIRDGITPLHTVCGRRIGDRQLLPEIADDRCGQCARRARDPGVRPMSEFTVTAAGAVREEGQA